jgi:hypothetical protein
MKGRKSREVKILSPLHRGALGFQSTDDPTARAAGYILSPLTGLKIVLRLKIVPRVGAVAYFELAFAEA